MDFGAVEIREGTFRAVVIPRYSKYPPRNVVGHRDQLDLRRTGSSDIQASCSQNLLPSL